MTKNQKSLLYKRYQLQKMFVHKYHGSKQFANKVTLIFFVVRGTVYMHVKFNLIAVKQSGARAICPTKKGHTAGHYFLNGGIMEKVFYRRLVRIMTLRRCFQMSHWALVQYSGQTTTTIDDSVRRKRGIHASPLNIGKGGKYNPP